ncbi:hypothetical protein ACN4DP_07730 [Corynebacterium macclintockiae]|uniref:hypothetical protein n=1 Tax=Corynebacterium macclintockiae TaxID=2913501 RepID=UPI003EBA865F
MNTIRSTINDMGRINMQQSSRVIRAAQEAHLRSQTRTARAFSNVGSNIRKQIKLHS